MNATAISAAAIAAPPRSPRLLGLRNLVRKDLSEWLSGRRPWIVLGATAAVLVLAAANSAINQWIVANVPADQIDGPLTPVNLVPMDNLLMAVGTQFSVLAAIFATMSLLIAERDSGTLAWAVSKPVSRTSILVSKWLTATVALWLVAIVVPIAITAAVVTALYGSPDLGIVATMTVLLATVPAIFVAITLAASTFVSSQAAVGAIALGLFILPSIVGGVAPALAAFFPTSIFNWAIAASMGAPAPVETLLAWAAGIAVLFAVARRRLGATDL